MGFGERGEPAVTAAALLNSLVSCACPDFGPKSQNLGTRLEIPEGLFKAHSYKFLCSVEMVSGMMTVQPMDMIYTYIIYIINSTASRKIE